MLIFVLLAGLFGLLIGSFLNVCIHRWPRDLSVVRPRSACVACGHGIAWYDNAPLVSYAVLKGRCRHCGAAIGWRYPVVELLTGLCFAWFVRRHGLSVDAAKYCVFGAIQIGLIFSDLETLLLPDEFTIGGTILGLAFSPFAFVHDQTFTLLAEILGYRLSPMTASVLESAFGAALPAGTLWLLGWLFEKLRHKEGLGFGDVKMIAMIGAFLGIQGAVLTVIVGSLAGSILGFVYIKARKLDAGTFQLPFASFLGAAGLIVALRA